MKIETAENGYIVETEDIYKYIFPTKKLLFEFLDKNIADCDFRDIIIKGCDVTK